MKNFTISATVCRSVQDTISLVVKADDLAEAKQKAYKALQSFPQEHDEQDIPFCVIENREYVDVPAVIDMFEIGEQND